MTLDRVIDVKLISFDELKPKYRIPYGRDDVRHLGNHGKLPRPIKVADGRRIAFIEEEIDGDAAAHRAAHDSSGVPG